MRLPSALRRLGSWPAATAIRYLLAIGVLVGAAGVVGRLLAWPVLTASLGPTAYVFAASAVTVLLLELVGLHYAPAAATAVLVATGLAQPGCPLIGLVVGLAIVIALGSLLGLLLQVRAEAVSGRAPTSAGGTNS